MAGSLRARRRRWRASCSSAKRSGGTNSPAASQTEDLLRKAAVAEALRAISAAHREILNETILRGRTVNEAAHALAIPVGTVKARVYYALRALRLVLAERAVTEPASYFDLKKAPITNRRLRFSGGSN